MSNFLLLKKSSFKYLIKMDSDVYSFWIYLEERYDNLFTYQYLKIPEIMLFAII